MFKPLRMPLYLKNITLENFKCFKKEQVINLEKLTILTGANSSGKSSILQSILGALQTSDFPLKYSTNGKYVSMGDFKEISYRHNLKNKIKIGFSLQGERSLYSITTVWQNHPNTYLPELYELSVSCDFFDV